MTNLNDTNSSQLHLHDLTGLTAGQSYRMKVEYLTKNDATGRLSIRRPKENYQSFASADLPGTTTDATEATDITCYTGYGTAGQASVGTTTSNSVTTSNLQTSQSIVTCRITFQDP